MFKSITPKYRYQYQCIEGRPEEAILQNFIELNQMLFELNESRDDMELFFKRKKMILGCFAFVHDRLIGFKIGFEREPHIFESWRGGIVKEFRGQGIATKLMQLQHRWCIAKGFGKVTTVTNANNVAMISLNTKHGFEVIQHTINSHNIQKVHFQKHLR